MVTVLVATGCQGNADVQRQEAEVEVDVVEAVLLRTTQWAEAVQRLDAAGVLDLFLNSDELRHTENGVTFRSHEALGDFIEGWYATTEGMDFVWEERAVVPLSADAATMTGTFRYEARQESGEVWAGRNVFTGVFVKRDGDWKLVHGHESTVPESEGQ